MRKKHILYLIVSVCILTACAKDKVPSEFAACSDPVSFSEVIQPLVEANCVGCHNEAAAAGDVILTNHSGISNKANLMIDAMQAAGDALMPFGGPPLSDSLIQLFQCWVLQGKLDN